MQLQLNGSINANHITILYITIYKTIFGVDDLVMYDNKNPVTISFSWLMQILSVLSHLLTVTSSWFEVKILPSVLGSRFTVTLTTTIRWLVKIFLNDRSSFVQVFLFFCYVAHIYMNAKNKKTKIFYEDPPGDMCTVWRFPYSPANMLRLIRCPESGVLEVRNVQTVQSSGWPGQE